MKTRLLMLLSVFMAITSVGWMQAQSITYYKTGSGSGGTGTEQDPIVKISLDEILGDANAKTESDSIVVSLSNGDYTAASGTFPITKSGIVPVHSGAAFFMNFCFWDGVTISMG